MSPKMLSEERKVKINNDKRFFENKRMCENQFGRKIAHF